MKLMFPDVKPPTFKVAAVIFVAVSFVTVNVLEVMFVTSAFGNVLDIARREFVVIPTVVSILPIVSASLRILPAVKLVVKIEPDVMLLLKKALPHVILEQTAESTTILAVVMAVDDI